MAGHITIADQTKSGAQAGIANSIKTPGQTVIGSPAIDAKSYMKSYAVYRKLPELYKQIAEMQKQIDELKQQK